MLTRKSALHTLGAFALSAMATAEPAVAAESAVVGAWALESFDILEKGGKRTPRYGSDPVGYLIYSASGRMSAILSARERAKLVPPPAKMAESDLTCVESIRPFLAYAGKYRIKGNHVFHIVETSVFTNLVGTTLEREFSLEGDVLRIRTLPPEIWGSANELTWRRA